MSDAPQQQTDMANNEPRSTKPGPEFRERTEYVRADIADELEERLAKRVTVKPLEWGALIFSEGSKNGIAVRIAETPFNQYRIQSIVRDNRHYWSDPFGAEGVCSDYSSAKAAAQADYTKHIQSALTLVDPWNPDMDAAPDDGTPVDLFVKSEFGAVYRKCNCRWLDFAWCEYRPDVSERHIWDWFEIAETVTHWMPLPTPPEDKA